MALPHLLLDGLLSSVNGMAGRGRQLASPLLKWVPVPLKIKTKCVLPTASSGRSVNAPPPFSRMIVPGGKKFCPGSGLLSGSSGASIQAQASGFPEPHFASHSSKGGSDTILSSARAGVWLPVSHQLWRPSAD